jgi:hypothetical protein
MQYGLIGLYYSRYLEREQPAHQGFGIVYGTLAVIVQENATVLASLQEQHDLVFIEVCELVIVNFSPLCDCLHIKNGQ